MMARSTNWHEFEERIKAGVNWEMFYRSELGLVPDREKPRENGILPCFALGRDDSKASAWLNTKTGGYGDKGTNESFGAAWYVMAEKFPNRWSDWR